jgi:hypothetical protein
MVPVSTTSKNPGTLCQQLFIKENNERGVEKEEIGK